MSEWKSSTPGEKLELQGRYASFLKDQGELYEDKQIPFVAEDLEFLSKKRKWFMIIWLSVLSIVVIFAIITLIYHDYFGKDAFPNLMWLVVAIAGSGYFFIAHLNKSLKIKEKRVIKGVITEKRMIDKKGCFLELSLKAELFQVWPEDYGKLTLGDIIAIEILSDDIYVKRKVTLVGKL